ncbi:MAG: hypothetical protein PQJ58_08025 [Spirochaetales bacterium]|nr:hypothetical protein [Spirochaetales bacterium]
MSVQSIAYNTFSQGIQKVDSRSFQAILDTVAKGKFPGSQLYLYFRMFSEWEESLDPSEFITDSAFIHRYKLPREEKTEELLRKHFTEPEHISNIFSILKESWA